MPLNWILVDYLVENHTVIMGSPVNGSIHDIYVLYSMFVQNILWNHGEIGKGYCEFYQDLNDISKVCNGCISLGDTCRDALLGDQIAHIDVDSMKILQKIHYRDVINRSLKAAHEENKVRNPVESAKISLTHDDEAKERPLLSRLITVLDDSEVISPNSKTLNHLNMILSNELSSNLLAKERVKFAPKRSCFMPVCTNSNHISLLSTVVNTANNKIVSVQVEKLRRMEVDCPGLIGCSGSHIHFIPNLKPQTDLSLGDCSYLDTCHKLNSCRYVHYLQYYPELLLKKQQVELKDESTNKIVSFYTHGECCSSSYKKLLPPQWIKCDVRKFDFSILGKFSVVIADPAWNIHMNLPYGTCNDNELLQLPFDMLQEEGLIFLWVTGRAIELGKESLQNWGYEVINEISWVKTNQLGRTIVTGRTGHWLNHSKEHLLVGVKGKPQWLNRQIDIDLIISATRETSRKPDELYGIIERLVGTHARKLEIFGRDHNIRPGWFTIGNQVTGSCIHELDVKTKYDSFVGNAPRLQGKQYDVTSSPVNCH